MPPLERFPSALDQTSFLSEIDNQHQTGKISKRTCSRIDLREVAVHAHRDLIFQSNPVMDDCQSANDSKDRNGNLDWVNLFTSLCSCQGSSSSVVERPRKRAVVGTAKNIMYSVARYPERLNSPHLVARRRKSLEKHLTFRPVVD
jgi:hypothetical protein